MKCRAPPASQFAGRRVFAPGLGVYLQTGECAITAKEPGSCYVFKITGVAHKDELDKEVVDWHASDEYFVRAQWFAVVGDNDTDDGAGSLRLSYYDATLELTVALNRISGSRDVVRARAAGGRLTCKKSGKSQLRIAHHVRADGVRRTTWGGGGLTEPTKGRTDTARRRLRALVLLVLLRTLRLRSQRALA